MAKFLANENVPAEAVEAARQAGHDLSWIAELSPGADNDAVLAVALAVLGQAFAWEGQFSVAQKESSACAPTIMTAICLSYPAFCII
jgi:hypothetical protein